MLIFIRHVSANKMVRLGFHIKTTLPSNHYTQSHDHDHAHLNLV